MCNSTIIKVVRSFAEEKVKYIVSREKSLRVESQNLCGTVQLFIRFHFVSVTDFLTSIVVF